MAESHTITAPLPGVFYYRRPAPNTPVMSNPGAAMSPGDVVRLVEIMKTF